MQYASNEQSPPFRKRVATLWALGIIGSLALFPYLFTLMREQIRAAPLPLPTLLALQLAQTAVLVLLAAAIGLHAAGVVGLKTPVLDAWLTAGPAGRILKRVAPLALASGAVIGGVVVGIDRLIFVPRSPISPHPATPPAWQGLLASLYGATAEEIFGRLFVMSVLAWPLVRIMRGRGGKLGAPEFWVAAVVSALVFGLLHLPAARAVTPLTPMLVSRVLLLNGVAGLVFAVLFRRDGLESAMLAHFATDLVLHGLPGVAA